MPKEIKALFKLEWGHPCFHDCVTNPPTPSHQESAPYIFQSSPPVFWIVWLKRNKISILSASLVWINKTLFSRQGVYPIYFETLQAFSPATLSARRALFVVTRVTLPNSWTILQYSMYHVSQLKSENRIPHFLLCVKIRPVPTHETPWRRNKNLLHCDTRRHGCNDDHKRWHHRVF